jgi:hypothetical protein
VRGKAQAKQHALAAVTAWPAAHLQQVLCFNVRLPAHPFAVHIHESCGRRGCRCGLLALLLAAAAAAAPFKPVCVSPRVVWRPAGGNTVKCDS